MTFLGNHNLPHSFLRVRVSRSHVESLPNDSLFYKQNKSLYTVTNTGSHCLKKSNGGYPYGFNWKPDFFLQTKSKYDAG